MKMTKILHRQWLEFFLTILIIKCNKKTATLSNNSTFVPQLQVCTTETIDGLGLLKYCLVTKHKSSQLKSDWITYEVLPTK